MDPAISSIIHIFSPSPGFLSTIQCLRFFLLLCSLWSALVIAQQTPPECALKCTAAALSPETCPSLTDLSCVCSNAAFNANVSTCVMQSCTIPESLVAQNVSATLCGAPIRNRAPELVVITNIHIVLLAVFVVVRIFFKVFVARIPLGWDDWTVIVGALSVIPTAVILVYGTSAHGMGKDIWTLEPEQITKSIKFSYHLTWLYFVQIAMQKLSLIFFYLRIFPSQGVQRLLWTSIMFCTVWGLAYFLTAIFQCQPISHFWDGWDGLHKGKCINTTPLATSHGVMSIALDLWILGIPLWQLRTLNINWKKKIGVGIMFCVGSFVTIVSIVRFKTLLHFASSFNVTWHYYDVIKWTIIEVAFGIICACLPTVRMVLVRIFPGLGGSSNRSRHYLKRRPGPGDGSADYGRSGQSCRSRSGEIYGSWSDQSGTCI
ncbi:hypothetical protein EJ05DRAFT_530043 [Pseudovirgaria hyperparasitica]|uniref:CFEM domain-containing protein n=1 Tax=Pseudovirgaria hyperparasitica TaxID=470096 RepID=A0A6A6WL28_9PEZI|nr:uncharacterized protein EJ05DRAFT_530043 [Pseudovirgaria hyperparasitica]KAF2762872.1 hypothetical protein EJ05DRAFT_530043 [Pseudovirgaria hyperparasitica]